MKKIALLSLAALLAGLSACQTPPPKKCCKMKCANSASSPDKEKHAKPM